MGNRRKAVKREKKTLAKIMFAALMVGILVSVSNLQETRANHKWYIEIVDSTGFSKGTDNSLALDSNDNPHISYYGIGEPTGLYYAHYNGASWDIECVDSTHNTGHHTSLALDANDNPHISYLRYCPEFENIVMYAYYDSSWHIEMLDTVGVIADNSIALDGNDDPHISYYDGTNEDLKYAYHDGASWNIEVVDSVGDCVGDGSSIALDANNNPRISYGRLNPSDLKYAHHDGTSWHIETVDSIGHVGGWPTSIALDSNDNPHMSYFDWGNLDLKYAYYDGTNWHIERVDSAGDVGQYCSIDLDSSDNPHMSYFDWGNADLKYACYDGTNWHTEIVDTLSDVGPGTSIALDSYGKPHISYRCGMLKYAYLSPCQVSTTALDFDSVTVGSYLTKTFTTTNTYGDTLSGSVTESCDHYSIDSGEGVFNLAAGESLTVTVRFAPTEPGTHNCTLETGNELCGDVFCTGVGVYDVTIDAYCYSEGAPVSVSITMDGSPTGYNTPHTFTGLTGAHTFTVPDTDPNGHPFEQWSTGETSTTLTVTSGGTYTAYYRAPIYDVTIEAYCYTEAAPVSVSITMDGSPTGYYTPHTFWGLTGTHTFTVPDNDPSGHPFVAWSTGETSTTVMVSAAGTYTAYYRGFVPAFTQWGLVILAALLVFSACVLLRRRRAVVSRP